MMKNREGVGKPKLSLVVPPFVSRGSMYRIRAQSYWTKDWAFGLVGREDHRDVARSIDISGGVSPLEDNQLEAGLDEMRACFCPKGERHVYSGSDATGRQDGLLWYKDTGQHFSGEFSMAVVQANNLLEDQSQLESGCLSSYDYGPYGTFVGIYDGHGGPETSRFINDNLFHYLKRFVSEQQSMSVEVIRKAFKATEEGFNRVVSAQWPVKPQIAAVGSCCLVGVICSGSLYIANLGDSRAVLGRLVKATGEILAVQLSAEHNASIESVRQELQSLHPHDSQIVVLKHNVWRVKGIIQITRSIGDVYLKKAEFNREPLYAKFRLREPFKKPILSSDPSISVLQLQSHDQFVIFASDGLWEHLSNQEAVDIVQHHPRNGIARRLVKTALREAAKKREMRYSDLKKIDRGVRRHFHDDITVVVVYLNSNLGPIKVANLSVKGGSLNLRHNSLAPCATAM
nr:probable protein phosphatase 2C 60 [Ipomoea batatas]